MPPPRGYPIGSLTLNGLERPWDSLRHSRIPLTVEHLRVLLALAGHSVAMGASWVVVNTLPTSRRFAQGPQACRFGCNAVGGDDAPHISSAAPVLAGGAFGSRPDWIRLGWIEGGDMITLLMLVPTAGDVTLCHGV